MSERERGRDFLKLIYLMWLGGECDGWSNAQCYIFQPNKFELRSFSDLHMILRVIPVIVCGHHEKIVYMSILECTPGVFSKLFPCFNLFAPSLLPLECWMIQHCNIRPQLVYNWPQHNQECWLSMPSRDTKLPLREAPLRNKNLWYWGESS